MGSVIKELSDKGIKLNKPQFILLSKLKKSIKD